MTVSSSFPARGGPGPRALGAAALIVALASGCASHAPSPATPTASPSATPSPDAGAASSERDEADEPVPAAARAAIRRTIQQQLDALARDDGATAFSFAAPLIQQMFGTPENFLRMVHEAYAPLVRPRSVRFIATDLIDGEVTQRVLVLTADGRPVVALFLMDRQAGGEWKILGCVLRRGEETVA